MPGKYDCPRDEVLDVMVTEGWANQSDGNVEAPTGHFAMVCTTEDEALGTPGGVAEGFEDAIAQAGLSDARELIGNYIVRTNNQGFVSVESFETLALCHMAYAELQSDFYEWDSE